MPKCLLLTSYPLAKPKHGGQVRAMSLMAAAKLAGWDVESVGIFPAAFFPPLEWGPLDIVLHSPELQARASSDIVFGDFHAGRAAAEDCSVIERLRSHIERLAPDVIQVEHPWTWPVLREALPSSGKIRIVYSSHNIESAARRPLFRLGLKRVASDALLEAVRLLEADVATAADLVLSISDLEAEEIRRVSGRPVVYLPSASSLASPGRSASPSRFAAEAEAASCRYAALMGSAYWPNVEGFFSVFADGLGFLGRDEQIWLAGALGDAVKTDDRFQTFLSINESRTRVVGFVDEREKGDFFAAAECVIVPVTFGAGAKLKTADAIASGRPVIATQHALEGYGPIVKPALGNGVYLADSTKAFRHLTREAFRDGLPGCAEAVRAQLSLEAMSRTWASNVGALFEPVGEARLTRGVRATDRPELAQVSFDALSLRR